MIDEEKILTLAVIISIVGISFLYVFSAQSGTPEIDLKDIDEDLLGSEIRTKGFITDMIWYEQIVLIEISKREDERSLTIVTEREIIERLDNENKELYRGSKIEVRGEVQEYDGELQLRIDTIDALNVGENVFSKFTPLSDLLETPEWFEDDEIKVRGVVSHKIVAHEEDSSQFVILNDLNNDEYRLTLNIESVSDEDLEEIIGEPIGVEGEFYYKSEIGTWILRSKNELKIDS